MNNVDISLTIFVLLIVILGVVIYNVGSSNPRKIIISENAGVYHNNEGYRISDRCMHSSNRYNLGRYEMRNIAGILNDGKIKDNVDAIQRFAC
jgi:hypothetical protein